MDALFHVHFFYYFSVLSLDVDNSSVDKLKKKTFMFLFCIDDIDDNVENEPDIGK